MKRIDPEIYPVTGREYTATDADGNEHIIVRDTELVGTHWNIYYVHPNGRVQVSSREHRTLTAARAHVATVGGWNA